MADERAGQVSSYLGYLPAIFQEEVDAARPDFLGRMLLAFEQILTGLGDPAEPGLEEILEGIGEPAGAGRRLGGAYRYFEPGPFLPETERAPAEFLEWLSGWVALSLRADLDELRQRDFIARAASLYRLRGTRRGLEEFVRIYTRLGATVNELNTSIQLGVRSTLGVDTFLDGGAPHFFKVLIRLPAADPEQIARHRQVVAAIIEMEKPAHTHYTLEVETPSFQIGVHSTVGVDTLLAPRGEA